MPASHAEARQGGVERLETIGANTFFMVYELRLTGLKSVSGVKRVWFDRRNIFG